VGSDQNAAGVDIFIPAQFVFDVRLEFTIRPHGILL
jgi:hypothetical protein